jgi:hypothetical protein
MKKLITAILAFLSLTSFSQLYDSAGFIKFKPVIQYRDTGSVKTVYIYVPGPIQYIHDTLMRHDTVYVQIPTSPPATKSYNTTFTQLASEVQNADRGAEQWHNGYIVPIAGKTNAFNVYFRFGWYQVEGATQGAYNWSYLDGLLNSAIQKRQKFGFGIMTLNPDGGGVSYGGGQSYYPQYLHALMQGESVRDWLKNGVWVPNYNSSNYQNRLLALNQAINAHLESGSYNGVRYKDVISYIDIRGYGSWGEWHHGSLVNSMSEFPSGAMPTIASLKRIVDVHLQGFPNFRLVALAAALDGGSTQIPLFYSPPEVAYYILTAKNNAGEIGIRRDQWGATDAYLLGLLENNKASYNGVALKTLILNKWKTAPIVGEPPGWNDNDFKALPGQIVSLHASSFGNYNYGVADPPNSTIAASVQDASFKAGYRYTLINSSVTTGSTTSITLNWSNKFPDGSDRAPIYTDWDIVYYVNGSVIGKSSLPLKYKTGNITWTDTFSGVPAGAITMKVVDPAGYSKSMSLPISQQLTDGTITLTQ